MRPDRRVGFCDAASGCFCRCLFLWTAGLDRQPCRLLLILLANATATGCVEGVEGRDGWAPGSSALSSLARRTATLAGPRLLS